MTALRLDDLRQHSDTLRLRSGQSLQLRFVEPGDADALQGYFRALTTGSRYNRFLGATSELPPGVLYGFTHVGEADRFTVIAKRLFGDTLRSNEAMIGLARKSGYRFTHSPGDWKLVRFEKHVEVAPQEIPCASWRLAAEQVALQAV